MGKSKDPGKKKTKQKSMTQRLKRTILLILIASVFIIFVAYYNLPDWTYYLVSATRLWLATDEVKLAYDTDHFNDALSSVEKMYDSTIEVYGPDGRFIYSSLDADAVYPEDISSAPTVDEKYRLTYEIIDGEIKPDKRGFLIKVCHTGSNIDVDFLTCYDYLPGGERIELCMQVSQVVVTGRIDFIITFVAILIALFIGYVIIIIYLKKFTKPIQKMCNITDRMAQLDFSQKCPETRLTEMTRLSESINVLSDNLDLALKDLQNKNEKLQKDIENEKTIDNLRQTFISGISHELKTPIAIIQGYAEGAKMFYESGNPEKASEYCDTISEEADRMNNMVMKLLEITKYSSGAYEPQREDFNIHDMVDDWFTRNEAILKDKGVTAVNNVDPYLMGNGDKIILASVLNNYLSNALSHVDGAKIITCFCEETEGKYRLYVRNTGKPIADKDIDKIWTSFYRADKSLSRSQGRFGLGLALVASIQKLHGEKYGVRNEDDGVSFWFDIKISEL